MDDAASVSELAGQLGYQRTPTQTQAWIERAGESTVALVAVRDGMVVAWVEAHELELLQYPRVVEIGGLVVSENLRATGIGKRLVEEVIEWGRGRGQTEVLVRSNIVREGAHCFYEGIGFRRVKTSHTFSMSID